jgi:tetratricopeptide (TPR) repeat protein
VLAEGVRYYYNVRGLWDNRRMKNYSYRIEAAARLGDASQRVLALAQLAEVLSKQSTLPQATGWLAQAEEAARDAALNTDARFELGHARALLAHAHGHLVEAEHHWRELLPFSATLDPQKHIINRRWLATALLDQRRDDEAAQLYRESLRDARNANDTRSVTGNTLKLAAIDLARNRLEEAGRLLTECHSVASRHDDRRRLAECHHLLAQLASLRGDSETAKAERERAIDLFGRMGMRREAETMREVGA